MAKPAEDQVQLPTHGGSVLPSVKVENYSLEVEDKDGFIGDKASKGAFSDILEKWRKTLKAHDLDPFGDVRSDAVSRKKLDALLDAGTPQEAGLVQSAVEDFAQQLALVMRKFLKLKDWREVACIAIGGGFQASRIGKMAVGRAALLLQSEGQKLRIEVIRNDPDHAGLIGAAHLLPPWMLKGYKAILALDIGGTNVRAGVVELNLKKAPLLADAVVAKLEHWRHADDKPSRQEAVDGIVAMLSSLIAWAEKSGMRLAPLIGIGCPGVIREDGTIESGAQNLPGNWETNSFNLPALLREAIPRIGEHETLVVMHNDAVVQGLSEVPHFRDCPRWAVLTIGTGLGNACFSNRNTEAPEKRKKG